MQEIEIFWAKFCPVFSASGKIVLKKYFFSCPPAKYYDIYAQVMIISTKFERKNYFINFF